MSCNLLTKWLTHYDPVHLGLTAMGIATGVHATIGQPWHWPGGGTLLFRASSPDYIFGDYTDAVGAAAKPTTSISGFAWRGHSASTEYDYVVRHVGAGGVFETANKKAARIQTDSNGDILAPIPGPPRISAVVPLAGGKLEIIFSFDLLPGDVEPQDFLVYADIIFPFMDWTTPIGTVPYSPSGLPYRFVTGFYPDTAVKMFGVRSRSAQGGISLNTDTLSARPDSTGPPDLDAPTARCGT